MDVQLREHELSTRRIDVRYKRAPGFAATRIRALGRVMIAVSLAAFVSAPPLLGQAQMAAQRRARLATPSLAFWKTRAPDTVTADIQTSRGIITVQLLRDWAPNGVDRFYNLARAGYYDDSRFYRVVYGFVAQFGIAGDPEIARLWSQQRIRPDSARTLNARGTVSFAQSKPTDRTTNVFINLANNASLDTLGFTPIGRVVQGMEVADSLYYRYGDVPMSDPPLGDPKRLYRESNKYMDAEYPKLDRIVRITVR